MHFLFLIITPRVHASLSLSRRQLVSIVVVYAGAQAFFEPFADEQH
jgi:hypothetical protein